MLAELTRWSTLLCGMGGVVLAAFAFLTRPRGTRRLCPGYATTRWGRLHPGRLLFRYRCGYDLTGLPRVDDRCSCPECGRTRRASRLLRPGGRLRKSVVALTLLALFGAGVALPWNDRGSWAAGLPTLVLVSLDNPTAGSRRTPISGEVDDRVASGEISSLSASLLASRIADGLRADDHHWNADRACSILSSLWPASRPALERMLTAGDSQARVLAAQILRDKCITSPSRLLLEACITDIGSRPDDLGWYIRLGVCSDAAEFLLIHEHLAQDLLEAALHDPDPHRRLVAAAIAGWSGDRALMPSAVPILVSHLADNRVQSDAKLAAPALFRFGPAVIPLLTPQADTSDAQQRAAVLGIIDQLEHPGVPYSKIEHRMPRISQTLLNPLDELDLRNALRGLDF